MCIRTNIEQKLAQARKLFNEAQSLLTEVNNEYNKQGIAVIDLDLSMLKVFELLDAEIDTFTLAECIDAYVEEYEGNVDELN